MTASAWAGTITATCKFNYILTPPTALVNGNGVNVYSDERKAIIYATTS